MSKLIKSRVPAYMGGLLLSLGAMIVIMQAKRAFAPTFHDIVEKRPSAVISPGGHVRIVYNEEPGYFLPPGFPTKLTISRRQLDGVFHPVIRLSYKNLVDRESLAGPLVEEGDYSLSAELYICSAPGVADCAKLLISQNLRAKAASADSEIRIPIDLPLLAKAGIEAGKVADKGSEKRP